VVRHIALPLPTTADHTYKNQPGNNKFVLDFGKNMKGSHLGGQYVAGQY